MLSSSSLVGWQWQIQPRPCRRLQSQSPSSRCFPSPQQSGPIKSYIPSWPCHAALPSCQRKHICALLESEIMERDPLLALSWQRGLADVAAHLCRRGEHEIAAVGTDGSGERAPASTSISLSPQTSRVLARRVFSVFSAFGFHLLEFCESESERASLSGKTVKVKVKGLSQANVSIWVLYSLGVC